MSEILTTSFSLSVSLVLLTPIIDLLKVLAVQFTANNMYRSSTTVILVLSKIIYICMYGHHM